MNKATLGLNTGKRQDAVYRNFGEVSLIPYKAALQAFLQVHRMSQALQSFTEHPTVLHLKQLES